jgi:hypothetical protein
MIVQDSEGMTVSSIRKGEVAFEIHLPQLVGTIHLKALEGTVFSTLLWVEPPMPTQNGCDCARARHTNVLEPEQVGPDLTPTPSRMSVPCPQDGFFHDHSCLPGAVVRTARSIRQAGQIAIGISKAIQPFVSGLSTDPKAPTELADIRSGLQGCLYELDSERHGGNFLPGHVRPPPY